MAGSKEEQEIKHVNDLDMKKFINRIIELPLPNKDKKELIANFENLVSAQKAGEEKLARYESLDWTDGNLNLDEKNLNAIVQMNGTGVLAFYDAVVNEKDDITFQRVFTNKRHLADLNKILIAGAATAANPGVPPSPEDAQELLDLLKKKSRDFGMSRLLTVLTTTALSLAGTYGAPVLGAGLTGGGAVALGAELGKVFGSGVTGLASGGSWLINNPVALSLSGVVAGLIGYIRYKEYNEPAAVEARKTAADEKAAKKEMEDQLLAEANELKKITVASDALNKVMFEYADKLESKGMINMSINQVLKGTRGLEEFRQVVGDKMAATFDHLVPYLPGPYDLMRGDFKELPQALGHVAKSPLYAAQAIGSGVTAAYNAMKYQGMFESLSALPKQLYEFGGFVGGGGKDILFAVGSKLSQGLSALGSTAWGPGDRLDRLNDVAQQFGKGMMGFLTAIKTGANDYVAAPVMGKIHGDGHRLERMEKVAESIGKGMGAAASGAKDLGLSAGPALFKAAGSFVEGSERVFEKMRLQVVVIHPDDALEVEAIKRARKGAVSEPSKPDSYQKLEEDGDTDNEYEDNSPRGDVTDRYKKGVKGIRELDEDVANPLHNQTPGSKQ